MINNMQIFQKIEPVTRGLKINIFDEKYSSSLEYNFVNFSREINTTFVHQIFNTISWENRWLSYAILVHIFPEQRRIDRWDLLIWLIFNWYWISGYTSIFYHISSARNHWLLNWSCHVYVFKQQVEHLLWSVEYFDYDFTSASSAWKQKEIRFSLSLNFCFLIRTSTCSATTNRG